MRSIVSADVGGRLHEASLPRGAFRLDECGGRAVRARTGRDAHLARDDGAMRRELRRAVYPRNGSPAPGGSARVECRGGCVRLEGRDRGHRADGWYRAFDGDDRASAHAAGARRHQRKHEGRRHRAYTLRAAHLHLRAAAKLRARRGRAVCEPQSRAARSRGGVHRSTERTGAGRCTSAARRQHRIVQRGGDRIRGGEGCAARRAEGCVGRAARDHGRSQRCSRHR